MKTQLKYLVLISVLFYLGGCVMGRSFAPFKWPEDTRAGISAFYLICSVFGVGVIGMDLSTKKEKQDE